MTSVSIAAAHWLEPQARWLLVKESCRYSGEVFRFLPKNRKRSVSHEEGYTSARAVRKYQKRVQYPSPTPNSLGECTKSPARPSTWLGDSIRLCTIWPNHTQLSPEYRWDSLKNPKFFKKKKSSKAPLQLWFFIEIQWHFRFFVTRNFLFAAKSDLHLAVITAQHVSLVVAWL